MVYSDLLNIQAVEDEIHVLTECLLYDGERADCLQALMTHWSSVKGREERAANSSRWKVGGEKKVDKIALFSFLLNEADKNVDTFLKDVMMKRQVVREWKRKKGDNLSQALGRELDRLHQETWKSEKEREGRIKEYERVWGDIKEAKEEGKRRRMGCWEVLELASSRSSAILGSFPVKPCFGME